MLLCSRLAPDPGVAEREGRGCPGGPLIAAWLARRARLTHGAEMVDLQALEREALRVYGRYATEVVEALGFCPWAQRAREEGRVRPQVLTVDAPEPDAVLDALAGLETSPQVEIGLLIFPRLPLDRRAFARFVAELREADTARHGGGRPPFALADFHPQVDADTRSPERLVPFIRRSPDPTVQAVRHSALSSVRLSEDSGTRFVDPARLLDGPLDALQLPGEPLSRRVARANLRTVESMGVAEVRALTDAIIEDRDQSYGRLGLEPPPFRDGSDGADAASDTCAKV
jgi:hypothetical protein